MSLASPLMALIMAAASIMVLRARACGVLRRCRAAALKAWRRRRRRLQVLRRWHCQGAAYSTCSSAIPP